MKNTHSIIKNKLSLLIILLCALPFTKLYAEDVKENKILPIYVDRVARWGGSMGLTIKWINSFPKLEATEAVAFTPDLGHVILEINGYPTKDMQVSQFNEIFENSSLVKLKYIRKIAGKNETAEAVFKYEIIRSEDSPDFEVKTISNNNYSGTTVLVDDEIDLFNYDTYDILIIGNDPLTDKNILQNYVNSIRPVYARNTEHPDILFMISKNVNQDIQSIYIPKTEQVVNTGSSTGYYSFFNIPFSVTTQNSKVYTSGDYTKTVINTDAYLQFAVLDTRMMADSTRQSAPVIYQYTYDMHLEKGFNPLNESRTIASYNPFPYKVITGSKSGFGFCFKAGDILDIVNDSPADKAGFKAGDNIIAVNGRRTYTKRFNDPTCFYSTTKNEYILDWYPISDENTYTVKRRGEKITLKGGYKKISVDSKCLTIK